MKFNIPTYEFTIDENDESGVNTISLVTVPAMKSKFIMFDEQHEKTKYIFIQKDEKQYKGIVAGLSMIPEKMIYRIGDDGQEYNGYFTADTIEKIRNKYHKNVQNLQSVNLEHSNAYVNAYLVESYILDSQALVDAVKAKGIDEAKLGSWYTAFKIENKDVFNACLAGEFTGFSVEAYLDRELKMSANNFYINKSKEMKQTLIQKIKEKVNSVLEEIDFEDALIPELNVTANFGKVNEKVTKTYTNTMNSEVTEPIGAGEFTLEDGRILMVDTNSKLTEIRAAVPQPKPVEKPVPTVDNKTSGDGSLPVSGDTKPVVPVSGATQVADTQTLEAYPWDKCMADMEKQYGSKDTASKVCGSIKAGMSQIEAEAQLTPEEMACKKKILDESTPPVTTVLADVVTTVLADVVPLATGNTVTMPADSGTTISTVDVSTKTLGEIVGTKDGEYSIDVTVQGGKIVAADVESAQDLVNSTMMAEQKSKLDIALAEIVTLKAKLAEPIGTPKLGFEKENLTEVTAFSNYEKIARRNNLPIV